LTIEDPIEFVYEPDRCLIHQREIGRHTQSFANALRAALREDPDIVLVGEMRDLETIKIAIETAETGHLVFGTLHTNTAISTVDRIVDQFPADQQQQIRVMLSESLKGVISQTLLKKIGKGRVAAQEIMVVGRAISSILREGKTQMLANQMTSGRAEGNVLLNEVLLKLVMHKEVEPMEAYVKSVDKVEFLTMLKAKGISLVEEEEGVAS
jgi:twitching motility protein PilT